MPNLSGVLIACDYDNTLVYTAEALSKDIDPPPVSARNREAILRFMEEGGIFSICTGRARPAFEPLYSGIPMNGPTIMFNGAAIFDFPTETYLKTNFLPNTSKQHVSEALTAFPFLAAEIYHPDNTVHAVQANSITHHHAHITKAPSIEVASMDEVSFPIAKALFEMEPAQEEEVVQYLNTRPWANLYEIIPSSESLVEMTSRGANKGSMVLELAKLLHIERKNIYCVGDHANDISMLEVSNIPYAPANSIDEVLAFPHLHLLPDSRDDAIASMIEELEELYS